MKTNLLSLTFGLALVGAMALVGPPAAAQEAKEDLMQTPQHLKRRMTTTVESRYLLYLPKDYEAKSGRRWPLVLFLHGAGERGTNLAKVAVHGPPKLVKQKKEFPFLIVSPQCPEDETWSNQVLFELLDEVMKKHAVDARRVYATGLSMGGYGTWSLALERPERFAAVAPICGGANLLDVLLAKSFDTRRREALRRLPIWAFHGGKDDTVPVSESERLVTALKGLGCRDVRLTVYPEAGHDSWTETYNNPAFYEWLLKQERQGSK